MLNIVAGLYKKQSLFMVFLINESHFFDILIIIYFDVIFRGNIFDNTLYFPTFLTYFLCR